MTSRVASGRLARALVTAIVALGATTTFAHGDDASTHPTVWVANGIDGDVSVFDRIDGTEVARIPVGANPHVLETSIDGSSVYVVLAGGHDLPADNHHGHGADGSGAELATNSLLVLDAATGDVLAHIAVGLGPTHPVPSPDGTRVYVTNTDDDSVSVIDTSSWTVLATVTGLPEPHDGAITSDGKLLLLAAAGSNEVIAIDTDTLEVSARYPVGAKVRGLVVDLDDAFAYASNKADGTISRIDLASAVVESFAVGAGPHGLALAPDGSRLFVALSAANAVAFVDVASGVVTRTVSVGAAPEQLDLSPDGALLAVANAVDRTVSLVDVGRGAAVRSLPSGEGTFGVAFSNTPFHGRKP